MMKQEIQVQLNNNIQNIDNIAPKATVETSNNNGNKLTFRDITVTITADKDIRPVAGWNLKDNMNFKQKHLVIFQMLNIV